jgi:hypothetical protein
MMARWRVDYIAKGGKHLGTVEAPDERSHRRGSEVVPHHAGTNFQDCVDEDRRQDEETRMISPKEYYDVVVKPTVDEFQLKNDDIRLALLASMVTLHVVDYVMQHRASSPKEGDKWVHDFNADAATKPFAFQVVREFALASKHCQLSKAPHRSADDHIVATPAFVAVMQLGRTFLGDTVGGVTIHWKDNQYVNLSQALTATLKFYEAEFPEILT